MMEFQEKIRVRRLLYSKLTLAVLVILIGFLGNALWGVYKKQSLTRDNLDKTAATFDSLQAREKMLSSEIDRLKTVKGTEQEIREKYGLIKPGEEVIVVVDDGADPASVTAPSGASFWQKVKDWLK
jgi:cell division protein FtsB